MSRWANPLLACVNMKVQSAGLKNYVIPPEFDGKVSSVKISLLFS